MPYIKFNSLLDQIKFEERRYEVQKEYVARIEKWELAKMGKNWPKGLYIQVTDPVYGHINF